MIPQFPSQLFIAHFGIDSRSRQRTLSKANQAFDWFLASSIVSVMLLSAAWAQPSVPTSRADNARDGANTNETFLTPANVNKNNFGRLFKVPVDYVVLAQPLYMPNVNIPGQGVHNVVYVATQKDSVYAIDADNGTQLWYASMLNGGSTASGAFLPCGTGPGYNQEGIPGTPAIDPATNTMYLVAKTVLGSTVRHHLHAIDITTGLERAGSPVLIQARSVSNIGTVTVFNSLHEKNRPGLLLANGAVYIGFGSNSCNDNDTGWILSYDATSLTQLAVFNTSPDYGLTSIWQSGVGLTADENGYIYAETAETGSHGFDVPGGGQTYCNSVLKLAPDLTIADYFTPWSVAFLNAHDMDLSSSGVVALPDLTDSPFPHEIVAAGKQGFVYVLNRDSLGMFSFNDMAAIQEFALIPGETQQTIKAVQFGSPAYWNNTVYFAPKASPILAYPLSGGLLGTPAQTAQKYNGSHSPSISANGNTNGIIWVITGQLYAFDAVSLQPLYNTSQVPGRDKLPPIAHFVTQTVANGRVYVATQTSLEVYGLYHTLSITGGGGQSATANTPLSAPLQVRVGSPYGGQPDVGVTVTFTDGCVKAGGPACGTFNPSSAVTDANGNASTVYTVPRKAGVYTLTAASAGFASGTATATSTPGTAVKLAAFGGSKQSGPAGSILPNPISVQARDTFANGVPGIIVNFVATKGGITNPVSAVTGLNGLASTTLQLPTIVTALNVDATAGSFKKILIPETSVAGPAANITVASGNNQFGAIGTPLAQPLVVLVTDQYGNAVPNNSVTFSDNGAGGTFLSPNPQPSGSDGTVMQSYQLPSTPGTITITATATGDPTAAVFTETAQ